MITFAGIDSSNTIIGNDPREENNESIYGGVLQKNNKTKSIVVFWREQLVL